MNEYKAVADNAHDAPPPLPAAPIMLRNEFSVCRVYVSTGTLRSFDRRPPNPPAGLADHQAAVHCGYQQQPLPPPAVTTTSHHQQMLAAVVGGAAANNNNGRLAAAENSHDSSSSGSQGGSGVVDGSGAAEDAGTAIDWDSLISPVDGLGFGGVDDLTRVIWPHN